MKSLYIEILNLFLLQLSIHNHNALLELNVTLLLEMHRKSKAILQLVKQFYFYVTHQKGLPHKK